MAAKTDNLSMAIISTAEKIGFTLEPVIDYYAMNVALSPEIKGARYFLVMPKATEVRYGDYDVTETTRIELVAATPRNFTNKEKGDYEEASFSSQWLRDSLNSIIGALMDTELYENIPSVTYETDPNAFDMLVVAVKASFNLTRAADVC